MPFCTSNASSSSRSCSSISFCCASNAAMASASALSLSIYIYTFVVGKLFGCNGHKRRVRQIVEASLFGIRGEVWLPPITFLSLARCFFFLLTFQHVYLRTRCDASSSSCGIELCCCFGKNASQKMKKHGATHKARTREMDPQF